MRQLIVLSIVPLFAVGGQHLLSGLLLAPGQQEARRAYVARSRTSQLGLLGWLDPARRHHVLRELVGELERAPRPLASPALLGAVRRCLADASEAGSLPRSAGRARGTDTASRCPDARGEGEAAAWRARKELWWSAGYQLAVGVGVGLVLVTCGVLLARRTRGAALGLAVAGSLLGLGGAAKQVQRAIVEEQAAWVEAQRGFWITRSRLALLLPPAKRQEQLGLAADALEDGGVDRVLVSAYRQAASRCSKGCDEARVLQALSRIHAVAPPDRPRTWLERWLLWISAALLLLAPVGRGARPGSGGGGP